MCVCLDDELISKIHKQVYVQYNTLNIAVGRQRCGKTHTIITIPFFTQFS